MITLMSLALIPAMANPLEVALGERVGSVQVPSTLDVGLAFKGATVEATWDSAASSSLAIACTDKGQPPTDAFVDKLMLEVGNDKWALAPGSSVKFSCPAGKSIAVTDLSGESVGAFKESVVMTVAKLRPKAAGR